MEHGTVVTLKNVPPKWSGRFGTVVEILRDGNYKVLVRCKGYDARLTVRKDQMTIMGVG